MALSALGASQGAPEKCECARRAGLAGEVGGSAQREHCGIGRGGLLAVGGRIVRMVNTPTRA